MAAGQMAKIVELLGQGNSGVPIRYTCADGTAIPKGTILKIADPRTALASTADDEAFAGICATEKVANDGQTTIAAYTKGLFELTSKEAITAGNVVYIKDAQKVGNADDDALLRSCVGITLETTAGDDEVAVVFVGGIN